MIQFSRLPQRHRIEAVHVEQDRVAFPLAPMVAIGYRLAGDELLLDPSADVPQLRPEWEALEFDVPFHVFSHQYGGLMCDHAEIVGLLIPLQLNLGRLRGDGVEFIELLRDLAESRESDWTGHSGPPILEAWYKTHGEQMDRDALVSWREFLGNSLEIPRLEFGAEALLSGPAVDLIGCFNGWCFAKMRLIGDSTFLVDAGAFDQSSVRSLGELGRAIGRSSPPEVFFLWWNSD